MVKNALQAQLLKAGLVDNKKAKKLSKQAQHEQRTGQGTEAELQAKIAKDQQEKVARDQALNEEKQRALDEKALKAAVIQMIGQHKIRDTDGDNVYQFIDDAKVTMIAERYNTSGYVHFLYENDSIDKKKLLYNGYTCGSTYIISPDAESNSFVFNLTNVGLGVTKNISLFWSFDTLKVINVFNDNKPILYLDSIKFENSNFIFFEKDGKNIYSEFSHRIDKQTNYVLPINNSNETVNCKLPYLYLKLYSCYEILSNFFQLKSDLRKEIKGEFPTLQLKVTYNDIDNSRYSKNYVINI